MELFSQTCVILYLDGAPEFTPAQEQQPVCPDPGNRPMCQHKQKQVHSSAVGCLPHVSVWKTTQSPDNDADIVGVVPESERLMAAST